LLLAVLGIPRVFCCLVLLVTMRTVSAMIQCMPSLRPWLLPPTGSFVSRGMLLVLGFLNIQHKRIVVDPDTPEAPTAEKRSRQSLPIIVSNHVSWVDILLAGYLYRCAL
jgi:1-acyl-sn-glycerol-3-phosphate acyltransferase